MVANIYTILGQIYLIPFIKITHTQKLNGKIELIIGWLKWEIVFGV